MNKLLIVYIAKTTEFVFNSINQIYNSEALKERLVINAQSISIIVFVSKHYFG